MGTLALNRAIDSHKADMLLFTGGYWNTHDIWELENKAFSDAGITTNGLSGTLADFSSFKSGNLKLEMKFYLLNGMKNKELSVSNIKAHYVQVITAIGKNCNTDSFEGMTVIPAGPDGKEQRRLYELMLRNVIRFITDFYDERPELERDKWHALLIPGVKLSAAAKRNKQSMSFEEIPNHYRNEIKRYMKHLIYRRSWSFCAECLMYIRYFYRSFYEHGYADGFQEKLTRADMEKYFQWVSEDYENNNATFRSKAVSFVRYWLDFIQLAEFGTAPEKDVTRLIFDEDIPRRERISDTFEKIKYIPLPVRTALDAVIDDIEPAEMKPVYILLRETGWRGTDILNLRYDKCLDYVWNSRDKEYVPYLYDEITKTGIPLHKIPIRPEVAEMVSDLIKKAKERSTEENNPDRYLFNTYEGRCKGLPYSKPAFAAAVNDLIARKGIKDGSGELYHFKTHSLRHTRAMEYTEQGMPIGIIQQILGHCSLQMTLHYAKVSEDMLYKTWKETEKLDLFKPETAPPNKDYTNIEEVRYEHIRKSLDAVRVPFGTCFKPSKIECKNQMRMCLECSSFCSTKEDLPSYDAEINRVRALITIAEKTERSEWKDKNVRYLENLVKMKESVLQEGIVHKNGTLREETDG